MGKSEELFDIFDEAGNHVGTAPRGRCHGDPSLIHRTSHVVVFHPDGRLLLQLRRMDKDIQPGKWDTAVGGHLDLGEDFVAGARRELAEELGVRVGDSELVWLFETKIRNSIESENVGVFGLIHPGPFSFQKEEIDAVRFWTRQELFDPANQEKFTPNLCKELKLLDELGEWPPFGDVPRTPPTGEAEGENRAGLPETEEAGGEKCNFHSLTRFFRDPLAAAGVIGLLLLFLPALFAPFIANGKPLFFYNAADASWSMPFLRSFFAPDSNEVLIEKSFNFILLCLCIFVATRWFLRKIGWKMRFWFYLAVAVSLLLPFLLVPSKLDKTDYRKLTAEHEGSFALFAPIPYNPEEQVALPFELPSREHPMGTDNIGRSVASRMIYGGRVSLAVGIAATTLSLVIGCFLGLYIGYKGGKIDLVVMRIVEILICFPTFLLLLILMAIFKDWKFEQSILVVIAVLGLSGWIGLCQLVRGEVLKQRALPYVQSCKAIGLSTWRTMLFHLLPNVSAPIVITFSFSVAGAILAESSLSFLGFGVQPPTASWGGLLRQAFSDPFAYWHLTVFPGIALFLAIAGFNFTGEALRTYFDPKAQ